MKILIVTCIYSFIQDTIDCWIKQGHDVKTSHAYNPEDAKDRDIIFFEFIGKDFAKATHCPVAIKKKIVGRLHRIEYYKGSINKTVDWTKVHALIITGEYFYNKIKSGPQAPVLGECLNRTYFVPYGVNQHKFSYKEHHMGIRIGWMAKSFWARKDPVKAISLVYAMRHRLNANFELYMAAGGGDRGVTDYIKYIFDNYPELGEHVHLVGKQDADKFYDDKDYLLNTSTNESFCFVIAEAMLKGVKPLIWDFESANLIWPKYLTFFSEDEMFAQMGGSYESANYRKFVIDNFSIEKQLETFDRIFIRG